MSSDTTRHAILDAALAAVTDRSNAYGAVESNFNRIAALWNTHIVNRYRGQDSFYFDAVDVALMLALLKIARIENMPGHMDSWVDLAGYAACGGEAAAET